MHNFSPCHDSAENESQGISNSNLKYLTCHSMCTNNLHEKIILKIFRIFWLYELSYSLFIYFLLLFHCLFTKSLTHCGLELYSSSTPSSVVPTFYHWTFLKVRLQAYVFFTFVISPADQILYFSCQQLLLDYHHKTFHPFVSYRCNGITSL